MSTKTRLLIDGDMLVYQAGLAVEKPIGWDDDVYTIHADLKEAKDYLLARVSEWERELGASASTFALSCATEEGFRRQLCPTYKANRKNHRKPLVYGPLREFLLKEKAAWLQPRLEADDLLGILATEPTKEHRIIVSVDKDYKGVPAEYYCTKGDMPFSVRSNAFEAARFHAMQTLMGDRVDGYNGIEGVGPKTAEKILSGCKKIADLWPAVVAAYKEAGLSKDLALNTARLARILQWGDYDFKTRKIKLWTPLSAKVLGTPTSKVGSTRRSPRT